MGPWARGLPPPGRGLFQRAPLQPPGRTHPRPPPQLNPEDEERRRLRRERNKLAAAKCRNRRKELTESLQQVRPPPPTRGHGENPGVRAWGWGRTRCPRLCWARHPGVRDWVGVGGNQVSWDVEGGHLTHVARRAGARGRGNPAGGTASVAVHPVQKDSAGGVCGSFHLPPPPGARGESGGRSQAGEPRWAGASQGFG